MRWVSSIATHNCFFISFPVDLDAREQKCFQLRDRTTETIRFDRQGVQTRVPVSSTTNGSTKPSQWVDPAKEKINGGHAPKMVDPFLLWSSGFHTVYACAPNLSHHGPWLFLFFCSPGWTCTAARATGRCVPHAGIARLPRSSDHCVQHTGTGAGHSCRAPTPDFCERMKSICELQSYVYKQRSFV